MNGGPQKHIHILNLEPVNVTFIGEARKGSPPEPSREQGPASTGRQTSVLKRCGEYGEQNNGPLQNAHVLILIPRTCDHVPLHGKRGFPGVTKLRAVRWEKCLGLSRWVLVSKIWRQDGWGQNERQRRTGQPSASEDGGSGQELRNAGSL